MDVAALIWLIVFAIVGLVTCALSLKIIIWIFNGLFFGSAPESRIPTPSFLKSTGLNLLTFLVIASIVAVNIAGARVFTGSSTGTGISEPVFALLQSMAALIGYVALWVVLKMLLPTSWLRAFLVAFVHTIMMTMFAVAAFLLMLMLAYSTHSYVK